MTQLSPDQIQAALNAGIITPAQAQSMLDHGITPQLQQQASLRTGTPLELGRPVDPGLRGGAAMIGNEDDMRFMRSFSDIFIAIGIALLALGMLTMATLLGGKAMYLVAGLGMWVLAEYFGRYRRAHLPTLFIAMAFLGFIHLGMASLIPDITAQLGIGGGIGGAIGGAGLTFAAMLAFYMRFRLPFCVALIAISLTMLVYVLINGLAPGALAGNFGLYLIAAGGALFLAALLYDARDPARLSRFADNAFWLHFAAAPMILHGIAIKLLSSNVVNLFGWIPVPNLGQNDALALLLVITGLAVLSLAINRRALLVSSLGYAGLAIAVLIRNSGIDFTTVIAATFLLLGGVIVFLGAGWHQARGALLRILPTRGGFSRLFPPSP